MIINNEIRKLVNKIESEHTIEPYFNSLLKLLIENCHNHTRNDISYFQSLPILNTPYPIIDGFAKSFDPFYEEEELLASWYQYGFVVAKNVSSAIDCKQAVSTINQIMYYVSMSLEAPESYLKDSCGNPLLSRGFFELYHDDCLAQLRQNIRLYLYYVILWGSPFLWTSFDRLGIKTPQGQDSIGLPLHVDQNPSVHPDFTTIQGVLALEDCPLEVGTFVGVPGSKEKFKEYTRFIDSDYKGEYIELPKDSDLYNLLYPARQYIPIKQGNIVSWDSRTTHANSSNNSNVNRYVAYISTGLAKENNNELIDIRHNFFKSGLGYNVREAYLHASKKPRFTNEDFMQSIRQEERLNSLGLCLYGLNKYKDYL